MTILWIWSETRTGWKLTSFWFNFLCFSLFFLLLNRVHQYKRKVKLIKWCSFLFFFWVCWWRWCWWMWWWRWWTSI